MSDVGDSYFIKLISRDSVKDQLENQGASSGKTSSSGKERSPIGHH